MRLRHTMEMHADHEIDATITSSRITGSVIKSLLGIHKSFLFEHSALPAQENICTPAVAATAGLTSVSRKTAGLTC